MYQAGWWPDPGRRHQLRYHDGNRWTEHVSDNGINSIDPFGVAAQPYFVPVPAPTHRSNGLAVASLVLGILAALCAFLLFLLNLFVGTFARNWGDPIQTMPESSYNVVLESCGPAELHWLNASGTIQNTSNTRTSYWISVHFLDGNGEQVAEARDVIRMLDSGLIAHWTARSTQEHQGAVSCEIVVE